MRLPFLDLLRGLAVLLMVLDHSVVVLGWPEDLRHFTRPALPLFMVVSGFLFSRLGPRYLDVVLIALASWPAAVLLGIAWVHVLLVYVLVLPFLVLPLGLRLVVASVALLQAMTWPIGWGGYEPGYVFAFLALGNLLAHSRIPVDWPAFRSRALEWLGRWPLTLYLGHLWTLVLFKVVFATVGSV